VSDDAPTKNVCSLLRVRHLPVLCGAVLAASFVGTSLPAGAASASQPSASALLKDALNAAQNAGSMQFVDKTTVNGTSQTLDGVISAPTAGETLTGGAPLQVELIGGMIYVNGNQQALEQALQITAAQATPYANKWIVVQSTDAPFQLLAQDLTLSATLNDFTPAQKSLKIGKTQRIGKLKAIPISGASTSAPKGSSSSVTLFVSPKAPHTPVGGSTVLVNKSGRLNEVAVFTNWGAKVNLTAPTDAVQFSSILG
jgi:hypothetical protein